MNRIFNKITLLLSIVFILISTSCKEKSTESVTSQTSTQIKSKISDSQAEELVTKMELAMGGKEKWDDLHYVSWTFFGARHLIWDKKGGKVRIESPRDTSIYLVDLNELKGKISKGGKEVNDPKAINELVKRGNSVWINDSYWLFMPFKLRDPGVTVNYVREDTILGGDPASVLALTFKNVGDTPDNKYEVYIDKKDNLIKQWAFFKLATQETPSKIWPWDNYQSFDGLMLSCDRSDKGGPSNVRVYKELDESVFNSFEPFDFY